MLTLFLQVAAFMQAIGIALDAPADYSAASGGGCGRRWCLFDYADDVYSPFTGAFFFPTSPPPTEQEDTVSQWGLP
ncbi:MAG: hypothetical protein R2795_17515 [Saprospiraceae bacterium]